MESGWNVWVWLVGVMSRRRVWLVGEGGIYGCGCKEGPLRLILMQFGPIREIKICNFFN